jgi:Xaa-Pro aminopeptidase
MQTKFTADFFRNNRKKLRNKLGSDIPVVITANGLLQSNADNTFSFRQDSSFWYLTGIDEPDCVLIMEAVSIYSCHHFRI